jgi:hypothetical protein
MVPNISEIPRRAVSDQGQSRSLLLEKRLVVLNGAQHWHEGNIAIVLRPKG